jgi:hypothetical protein
MRFDHRIIDDYIKSIEYYYFQDFCDRLLMSLYPVDYTPVRAGGRHGDMKNDGYCVVSRKFFQAHATRGESAKAIKSKIKQDLEGCLNNWNDISEFIFITNDTLIGEIENYVDELRKKYSNVSIQTWGNKKLAFKIKELDLKKIEYVIDRNIVQEPSFIESTTLNAKYLITNEFDFIKSISNGDLSDFPFENPILLDNPCLKFLRSLINKQSYRKQGIENPIDLKESEYLKIYTDSKQIPYDNGEHRFFYHERIPTIEEITTILKEDAVSQLLIHNQIPANKISKINTCYESECDRPGRFQELFLLRPLYAQFIVVKNISNLPVKLDSIESVLQDGILNQETLIPNYVTKLPDFTIEPQQNIIVLIGLFLIEFKEIEENYSQLVTFHSVPEQVQELKLGSLEVNPIIEYIGPRLIPNRLNINNDQESFCIHEFSMDNVYWINRYWMCGSCPHLFFINSNGKTLYQGEIFIVPPDQVSIIEIEIPENVEEVLIVELEKEITQINYLKINDKLFMSNILLNENEYFKFKVNPNDRLKIEGKYTLRLQSNEKLTIIEKKNLIEKFKKNYAQHHV